MVTHMEPQALAVDNLTYRIDHKTILDRVSFTVEPGAFLSILGPNGAGKTTLIKCVNRILKHTQGDIRINGRPLHEFSQTELAKRIGYVPQGGADNVPFTVFEFVMLGRYPHLSPFTSPTPNDVAAVELSLQLAGVTELGERTCATLSGGEKQRVLIAAALAQDARILLLDEPTTFLDPHHQQDVLALLTRLNRETGITIIAVTHDINAAALTSTDVLALLAGQVAFHGTPEELMTNDTLTRIFNRSFHFVPHPVSGRGIVVPEDSR